MNTTLQRARTLVLEYGWNATAYQILNPGIQHWFSTVAPAVVGFVPRGRTWVIAGAPVCPPESLPAVTSELEQAAAAQNRRVCYVAAASRLDDHFRHSPHHARITIGAQPVWNPHDWPAIVNSRSSLRSQILRARNKGVTLHTASPDALRADAALQRCLREWLVARPLPPLHFLVEPNTWEGELTDRLLLIARQADYPVAFLLASPVPQRRGFLLEQLIRFPSTPNGTAELLIDTLMSLLAKRGDSYLTMGLVPLACHADSSIRQNPLWLRAIMSWARAHGRRFYHFDGLENFRTKMCPREWEPIYAISNEKHFSLGSLHAMLAAFTEGSLFRMIAAGLVKAVVTEFRRLRARLN